VLFLGDSHARGYASEVKRHLNNEYEVFSFINPGSGMKDKKGSRKMKVTQLTNKGIYSGIMGRCDDVAGNNSVVAIKHILDLLINSTHTNVILLRVPHRQDLINDSCVNTEVKVFSRSL